MNLIDRRIFHIATLKEVTSLALVQGLTISPAFNLFETSLPWRLALIEAEVVAVAAAAVAVAPEEMAVGMAGEMEGPRSGQAGMFT